MDKENVVHLHNEVLHSKNNNNKNKQTNKQKPTSWNFLGKWMELENIILSEITQTQKDNYHMYSLIGGF